VVEVRNILFYVICALIAAVPAFAGNKKTQSASDAAITQARLTAAAAEEGGNSALAEEATQSLTVNENSSSAEVVANAEASTNEEAKALSQDEIKNMKESEIPLLGAEKQTKKSESSPWFRLIATVGVLGVLFFGAKYGIKKYARRSNSQKAQGTKIRVVTNHHLGPKKSLMIVNVAGESLLLGVTDHNITILKNLSLLEEELPADVPSTFAGAINETFVETKNLVATASTAEEQEDDFAVQGLAQIKDKVSSRLKNMRQI
jgi:flagellar protein FliO/FliZ